MEPLLRSKYRTVPSLQRNSLLQPPYIHTSILVPWQPLICFHLYSFVMSKMLYKWNHAVYNLLGLTYFTMQNALEMYPGCCMYQCMGGPEFI